MNTIPNGYPENRPSEPDLGVAPDYADLGTGPDATGQHSAPETTFLDAAPAATDFGGTTIAGYPAHKPADAPAPSPLYTADGSQTGARKQPRPYSVTMLMFTAAVLTAAVFGIIGTPGFVVAIVGISPVVLILALVALVATRST